MQLELVINITQLIAIKQLKTHEKWTMIITQSINVLAILHKNRTSLEIQINR